MYEKNFYDINVGWIPVDFAEDFFNDTFESWLTTIIAKIDRKEQLNLEEINQICTFIWFQEFRTNYRLDWLNLLYCMIEKAGINIKDVEKRKCFFRNMFMGDNIIGSKLWWTKRYVFHSDSWDFITSDHPLYLCKPTWCCPKYPLWIYSASLCFPLSKHSYLIAQNWEQDLSGKNNWKKEILYQDAEDIFVKISNRYSCRSISRFIIGKNLQALDDIISILNWEKTLEQCEKEINDCMMKLNINKNNFIFFNLI